VGDDTTSRPVFRRVPPQVDLAEVDRRILAFWEATDAFTESVARRSEESEYTFYDGPPFATGTPHYGHLLQAVVKDIVPRYWTMRGHRIERHFGWDTHGLPVEMEVEKELGVSGPRQIMEFGIGAYNEACRTKVDTTTARGGEWEVITRRIGRWVDMEDDYKTMDLDFMESVWWVFKPPVGRGPGLRGHQGGALLMGGRHAPLQLRGQLGDYRDVEDPSITVASRWWRAGSVARTGDELLIWTTTPWTLPSNLAVAVGKMSRVRAWSHDGRRLWVAEERAAAVLAGRPRDRRPRHRRRPARHHLPAAFRLLRERCATKAPSSSSPPTTSPPRRAPVSCTWPPLTARPTSSPSPTPTCDVLVDPIDAEGNFTDEVPEVAGSTSRRPMPLVGLLRAPRPAHRRGRSSTPIPSATAPTPPHLQGDPTWFVRSTRIRQRIVDLNKEIRWVPAAIGEQTLRQLARGCPGLGDQPQPVLGLLHPGMGMRRLDDQECIGSLDDLEARSGQRPDDIHKHVVDGITWPCPECGATMRRVPEVLDVWFDAGSMPYAQIHYPFENAERFEAAFPAQFISEGLDQTRGWFYTLHVLAVALFDAPAFRNCVVSGWILAEDGRPMSKRLKNYPDPRILFDTYGADAVRAYLLDSPLLRAEAVRFSEAGVRQVVRTVLLPLWNTHSFFTTYAAADDLTLAELASAPPLAERPRSTAGSSRCCRA
jgi:isoleucyl-tRNA synthetase